VKIEEEEKPERNVEKREERNRIIEEESVKKMDDDERKVSMAWHKMARRSETGAHSATQTSAAEKRKSM
jgi:hypothetical protein